MIELPMISDKVSNRVAKIICILHLICINLYFLVRTVKVLLCTYIYVFIVYLTIIIEKYFVLFVTAC